MQRFLIIPGLLAAVLLPLGVSTEQAHGRAAQADVNHKNNLRQIGLALHNYHDVFKHFPAAATYDKAGKPLLSWRVAILPHLDQPGLYKLFKQDEPWDSPDNIKLLEKMPRVFGALGEGNDVGKTYYRVFTGPGTVFEGRQGTRLTSITDGLSNTIMVVEARQAVPWTKPDELPYQENEALPRLGTAKDGFAVLMCDGAVMTFRSDFNVQHMRHAILRADGNIVDFSMLEK